jgi:nucleotide-binding universal stress UspA family protein
MKQIIVAIDFSKTSLNALAYGIHFANKAGADLQMVWVDNTTSEEVVFEGFAQEERTEKVALLRELQKKYNKSLKNGKLDFKTRKGKVYIELAQQAKVVNADMIITGTHGVSGFEEFWIGSNAYRIVTNAPCPVITLRHDAKVQDVKKDRHPDRQLPGNAAEDTGGRSAGAALPLGGTCPLPLFHHSKIGSQKGR